MRKGLKSLFCAFLISALIVSVFPVLSPEDASRNQGIDLEDAILHLQQLAEPATKQETFGSNLKNAFDTFHILAGLKTVIKKDCSKSSGSAFGVLGSSFLTSSKLSCNPQEDRGTAISIQPFRYQSISIAPTTPPPTTV